MWCLIHCWTDYRGIDHENVIRESDCEFAITSMARGILDDDRMLQSYCPPFDKQTDRLLVRELPIGGA